MNTDKYADNKLNRLLTTPVKKPRDEGDATEYDLKAIAKNSIKGNEEVLAANALEFFDLGLPEQILQTPPAKVHFISYKFVCYNSYCSYVWLGKSSWCTDVAASEGVYIEGYSAEVNNRFIHHCVQYIYIPVVVEG